MAINSQQHQLFISAAKALQVKYKALGVVVGFSLYWQKKGKLTLQYPSEHYLKFL